MGLQSNPSIRKLFIYDLFDCAFKFLGTKVRRMLKLKFFFWKRKFAIITDFEQNRKVKTMIEE